MTDDLLPHLGDKLVVFQSPTEGVQVFGTVVCISVKDAAKVRTAADRVQRALEAIANSPIKVRKKTLRGVEIRELYSRGFGFVTPTYAIVGDWLVVSPHPQAVQGFILRTKGELEKWKPDAVTSARLAKMPADGCGLQFCRPESTAQNLCCIGPLLIAQLAQAEILSRNNERTAYFLKLARLRLPAMPERKRDFLISESTLLTDGNARWLRSLQPGSRLTRMSENS